MRLNSSYILPMWEIGVISHKFIILSNTFFQISK